MLENTEFEKNGLKFVATSHASYIAIRVYDNKYIQSMTSVTNVLVDKQELLGIYNAITRSRFTEQTVENLVFEPTGEASIIKFTVHNHEFEVEYDWIEQVFKRFITEAEALE